MPAAGLDRGAFICEAPAGIPMVLKKVFAC
jgi:hypothetical protein